METPSFSNATIIYLVVTTVVVAAVLFVWLWSRRSRPETRRNPYIEALTYLLDGDTAGAFEKLQAAVRTGNAPVDAYLRLGRMLRERGDASKALQLHRGLTVRGDLNRREKLYLFIDLAEDYAALNRSDRAVSLLETAARRMGYREPAVYRILAREMHMLGRTDTAYDYLRDWRKTGAIGEEDLALYLAWVGVDRLRKGETREAARPLHRALRHDANCAPALLALGDLAEMESNLDDAIGRWRDAACRSASLAPAAFRRLERATFQRGRFGEMENVYRDVLEARPEDEVATLSLAAFYRKQGRNSAAMELLESFRGEHPQAVAPTIMLATIYASERDGKSVARLFGEDALRGNLGNGARVSSKIDWLVPNWYDTEKASARG